MKKFKIKKRVKRKYVHKDVAHQTFSLSKFGVGVVPTLFIIVGLLTTYIIAIAPTDTIFNNISIPLPQIAISLPQIPLPSMPTIDYSPLSSLLMQIQTSLSAFGTGLLKALTSSIQNSFITLSNAALVSVGLLQSIALSVAVFITGASLNGVGVIGQLGVALASLITDYLAYSWQVRVEFYTAVGASFVTLYGFIIAGSVLFATTVWHIILAKLFSMTSQVIVEYQGLVWLVATLFHSWITAVLLIKHTIAVGVYWTFLTLIMITKNLLDFGNAVVTLFLLPFQILGGYLVQTKPFWVMLWKMIAHAANDLGIGVKHIGELIRTLSTTVH